MSDIENSKIYWEKYEINIDPRSSYKEFCNSELFKKATPFIINPPYYSYK